MKENYLNETLACKLATECFESGLNCLMAHTLRSLTKYLNSKFGIFVDDIVILPFREKALKIINSNPEKYKTARSRLAINWLYDKKIRFIIHLHPHCSRSAARFAIAHEIYHLIHDIAIFKNHGYDPKTLPTSTYSKPPKLERNCDLFALRMCQYYHVLNTRIELSAKYNGFDEEFLGREDITKEELAELPAMELNADGICFSHQRRFSEVFHSYDPITGEKQED